MTPTTDHEQVIERLLHEPIPDCIRPFNVYRVSGSHYEAKCGIATVRRYFSLDHKGLQMHKISVQDDDQRKGLATAITLLVMDRLDDGNIVTVSNLGPEGRDFWEGLGTKGFVEILKRGRNYEVRLTHHGRAHLRSLPSTPPHRFPKLRQITSRFSHTWWTA